MPYLGNPAVDRFTSTKAASVYSGDGSTVAFTLEHSVGADEDILVSVDGVIQEPSVAYAVSSGTTLTFTAAPSSNSGNNIFVYYLFRTIGTVTHPPTSALSATSGTFSTTLDVTGDTTVGGTIQVGVDGTTAGVIRFMDSGSVTEEATISSDANGGLIFGGNSGPGELIFKTNSGTEHMRINAIGAVTKPLQPAFMARPASTQSNLATGDVIVFGTEVFDNNADFASNVFTAPVTGRYQLMFQGRADNTDQAAAYSRFYLKTSNRNYESIFHIGGLSADASYWTFVIVVLADMDASDTAFVEYSQGGGSNQADMQTAESTFSGYLVA